MQDLDYSTDFFNGKFGVWTSRRPLPHGPLLYPPLGLIVTSLGLTFIGSKHYVRNELPHNLLPVWYLLILSLAALLSVRA